MVGSLIMAASLMGQAPGAAAKPVAARPAAKAAARPAVPAGNGRRDRLDAAWRQRVLAERREAAEQAKARVEAEKKYKEMLPYMLEEQRQYLDRLSAMERNDALYRMAEAQRQQAGAMQSQANALWWDAYRRGR